MADHGADIDIRETLDVARAFLDTNKPRIPLPGTTPTADAGGFRPRRSIAPRAEPTSGALPDDVTPLSRELARG